MQWLARCPALTGIDLRVDDLPPAAGTGALFPKAVSYTHLQGWSTTLPRLGSRVRIPSRALLETGMCKHSGFCVVETEMKKKSYF